ncbi:MAG: DUF3794 domain-containing protein [Clostridia bacterium]|nr:DUF3794 domain-containing protein [Clostridia bacterium]
MSIELTSRSIGLAETFFDNYVEQGVDCDISLPDYCPDIMRILRCTLHSCVTNSKIIGDRATADGNVKIRIVYADEKNNIFCYEQDYPFSKYAELNSAYDGAVLTCKAKTEYVNCRAVSKRRADVHGVVSLHFTVRSGRQGSLVTDACGDGIQLKKKGLDIDDVAAVVSKTFEVSQVEDVGQVNCGIGKILDVYSAPVLNEAKLIKGKILLKGELAVRVVYCSDSGNNEACALCCNLPFNEIIEAPTVTDDCCVDVRLAVNNITAEPKTDNDGDYRYMNIDSEVCALVTAYSKQSVKVITDAYSTETDIDAKYRPMEFNCVTQCFRDTAMCKESLDVSSFRPQKVYAFTVAPVQTKCRFDGDKMIINGKIPVSLVVIDSEGVPVLCEREAVFEYSRTMEGDSDYFCNPQLSLAGCSCDLMGDGKADFKAEICISAVVFKTLREKVLVGLETVEGSGKKIKKPALVIYFCQGNESVWDIARRYNTTVEEIMQENELSVDYLENKTMLMIPVK